MTGKALLTHLLAGLTILGTASAEEPKGVKTAAEILASFDEAERTRAWPQQRKTTRSTTRGLPADDRGIKYKRRDGVPEESAPDSDNDGGTAEPAYEVSVAVVPGSAQHFENILFQLGKTEFADGASRQQVLEIATAMKGKPKLKFLIEGHTCDLGEEPVNKRLSEQRADAVYDLLVEQGVSRRQLFTLGFGENDLAVEKYDDVSRQKNRRVVVQVRP